jgi:hypothetical protein
MKQGCQPANIKRNFIFVIIYIKLTPITDFTKQVASISNKKSSKNEDRKHFSDEIESENHPILS